MRVDVHHPKCPYCHEQVSPGTSKTACNRCMGWHHAECWTALKQCGLCKQTEPLRFALEEHPSACPQCSTRLASCVYEGISLLLCDTCWAFWAPVPSLGQLLFQVTWDPAAQVDVPRRPKLEANLRCFECGHHCVKAVWSDLVLDVCAGHGVWFESGELVDLRQRIEASPADGRELLETILNPPNEA